MSQSGKGIQKCFIFGPGSTDLSKHLVENFAKKTPEASVTALGQPFNP